MHSTYSRESAAGAATGFDYPYSNCAQEDWLSGTTTSCGCTHWRRKQRTARGAYVGL